MRKEKVVSKFKVWDMKKLTEDEVKEVANEQFYDIVETHEIKFAYLDLYNIETPPNGQKVYCYKIVKS